MLVARYRPGNIDEVSPVIEYCAFLISTVAISINLLAADEHQRLDERDRLIHGGHIGKRYFDGHQNSPRSS